MPFIMDKIFGYKPFVIDQSSQLRTIKSGVIYQPSTTLFCPTCEFLFSDVRFSLEEMKALYSGYRMEYYTKLREEYEPGYRSINRELQRGIKHKGFIEAAISPHLKRDNPLIIDFGSSDIVNTPFSGAGEVALLPFPSPKGASKERRLTRSSHPDLIVCRGVMEHVSYPRRTLRKLCEFQSSDTIIYLEVPLEKLMLRFALIEERSSCMRDGIKVYTPPEEQYQRRSPDYVLSRISVEQLSVKNY